MNHYRTFGTTTAVLLLLIFGMTSANAEDSNAGQDGITSYVKPDIQKDENLTDKNNLLDGQGLELIRKGDYKQAIEKFTSSLKIYPNNIRALANRGYSYLRLNNYDAAISDFLKARSINPRIAPYINQNLGLAYLYRGRTRIDTGDIKAATSDLNEAATFPSVKPAALSELAYIAQQSRDFDTCIKMAEMATKLDADFTDPLINKGVCLYGVKKYAEALKPLSRAIELEPRSVPAHINRAAVYVQLSNCGAALKDGKKAVSLNPEVTRIIDSLLAGCH